MIELISTFFYYKKVIYEKVGLQRPKNKKVKGYNAPTRWKELTTSFKNPTAETPPKTRPVLAKMTVKNWVGVANFLWNAKRGKNMGGCQNFGWKKSKKWKKSGGGCNFGLIWENIQYLYRIFSCSPPLPSVPGHKITNFQRWHNIDTTVGKDTFAVPRSYPNLY